MYLVTFDEDDMLVFLPRSHDILCADQSVFTFFESDVPQLFLVFFGLTMLLGTVRQVLLRVWCQKAVLLKKTA
jgi:hypothetical protein